MRPEEDEISRREGVVIVVVACLITLFAFYFVYVGASWTPSPSVQIPEGATTYTSSTYSCYTVTSHFVTSVPTHQINATLSESSSVWASSNVCWTFHG